MADSSSFTNRFGLSRAALLIIGAVAGVTLLLAVTAVTAIKGWQYHRYLASRHENAGQITFRIEHFLIHHVRQSSRQLAELPAIQQAAAGELRPETPEVLILLRTARMLLAPWSESIVYLMDKTGLVVASTTYGKGQTLTGNNYRFRPYFTGAIAGRPVIYAALGVTTNQRGVYFSSPVLTAPNDQPQAVLVIKAGLEEVDHILAAVPQPLVLVSAEGVVFATNRPDWLFHTLFALPPPRTGRPAGQQTVRRPAALPPTLPPRRRTTASGRHRPAGHDTAFPPDY